MEKIPTTEEFLLEAGFPGHAKHGLAKKWMIEFAKLHVEAALKAASETKILGYHSSGMFKRDEEDKESILNSYPLEKIN